MLSPNFFQLYFILEGARPFHSIPPTSDAEYILVATIDVTRVLLNIIYGNYCVPVAVQVSHSASFLVCVYKCAVRVLEHNRAHNKIESHPHRG